MTESEKEKLRLSQFQTFYRHTEIKKNRHKILEVNLAYSNATPMPCLGLLEGGGKVKGSLQVIL